MVVGMWGAIHSNLSPHIGPEMKDFRIVYSLNDRFQVGRNHPRDWQSSSANAHTSSSLHRTIALGRVKPTIPYTPPALPDYIQRLNFHAPDG
jgi:hypothetical protein